MSAHRVDIVRLGPISKHGNADTLGLVKVFGWQCVVRLGEWHEGDLAAYCPPDSLVDTRRPEFAFLAREGHDHERIRVRRFRGEWSEGLLVPAPSGAAEGDDAAEVLGVSHYEPPEPGGDAEVAPAGVYPTYDVENWRRYPDVLREGEPVIVTEKICGASARFFHDGERFWVGSHRQWKREGDNVYWRALLGSEELMAMLRANTELVAYGEVYGAVQKLHYGCAPGEVRVALFDLWDRIGRTWTACERHRGVGLRGVPWVPRLYMGRYDGRIAEWAEGNTRMPGADHLREGCVVRPVDERADDRLAGCMLGRVQLKIIGRGYLERDR